MHLVAGILVVAAVAPAQQRDLSIRVDPGPYERKNAPIRVVLPAGKLDDALLSDRVGALLYATGSPNDPLSIAVQVTRMDKSSKSPLEAYWVHPRLAANASAELRLVLQPVPEHVPYRFAAASHLGETLRIGTDIALEYVYEFDPDRREETYKVYQHLWDLSGEFRLTKGSGGVHPHHRGIFLGWNHTQHGDDTYDFWSCGGGETIRHRRFLDLGPPGDVTGAQGAAIEWVTPDGDALVAEKRIVRAWRVTGDMHLFDFDVELRALRGPVKLCGNAHHAGFQVRLDQGHTADEEPAIAYLRPATADDLGNDVWTGCDWVAARFPMHGGEFVLIHMDAPTNPRPIRYSTRPYGRFGSACEIDLGDEPLSLRYRLVLIDPKVVDVPDADECERLYRDFADPPKVTVFE